MVPSCFVNDVEFADTDEEEVNMLVFVDSIGKAALSLLKGGNFRIVGTLLLAVLSQLFADAIIYHKGELHIIRYVYRR